MIQKMIFLSTQLLAQLDKIPIAEDGTSNLIRHLVAAIVYSTVGVLVLGASFFLITRFVPFSVVKEIEEDQNIALAILVASVILGISLIIAAAILG